MDSIIPVLNKLQDTFSKIGERAIDLPQIVVVGCQSSGKSSVLESLVQKDFLPRGSGIVTRRPLVLQLIHAPEGTKEYGVFLHKDGEKFYDFNKIREEIVQATIDECGDKGISNKSINLKIYSPTVPDLTLVDLPGLTKVATEGQPENLPKLINDMVLEFVTQPNAIILAITPANQDIANSDSLLMARSVDPSGLRTIGVLTKIDIMDKGTDCVSVLKNETYPLKLGYIGVVNRSQKDIDDNKPMDKVIESERRFFVTNPVYAEVADQCGYPYLSSTLNRILVNHIKEKLPSVHNEISQLLRIKYKELQGYGESIGNTVQEQQMTIYRIIEEYITKYSHIIYATSDLATNHDDGGSVIVSMLTNDFPQKLRALNKIKEMTTDEINAIMDSNTGIQPPLFFPESSFYMILRDGIEEMRPIAVEAADKVEQFLETIHSAIDFPELTRFPKVKSAIADEVATISKDSLEECQEFISTFIDIQKSYVNTAGINIFGLLTNQDESPSEQKASLLKKIAVDYFNSARKQVEDEVPKIIIRMIVKKSIERFRQELFTKLVTKPDVTEDPGIARRRKNCLKMIEALKEASSTLNEIRMIHL
jgi:GTP-binding protein EngB required for normal cell division